MDIAFREKIKKVLFTHHDPMATDESLRQMISVNEEYYQAQRSQFNHDFDWAFANDEMEVEI